MRYCVRCLYPENHPLGITFDESGVCSGCRIHEEKDRLDWGERFKRLQKICEFYRCKSGRNYDCVIPVSGARDSYFIVHVVKNMLKMHPLLVAYNKQYNTKVGIRNLAYLRTLFGTDFLQLTVSPKTVKQITKITFAHLGSMYWHCLAGQTVFPVQMAVRFKIPLIVWGAHQGCDQVGMFSHLDEVEMTRKYRKNHDLLGYEAKDLMFFGNQLTWEDVRPYEYPHDKELEKIGVRGIYLSNYIRWDSKAQHEKMIQHFKYESRPQLRTFDTYNDVDCFHYSGLHDDIKFQKWGYGKVTDHACREIRFGRLTREEGIELVRKYQSNQVDERELAHFLEWLGVSKNYFQSAIDQKRDLKIWEKNHNDLWILKDSVTNHLNDPGVDENRLKKCDNCQFQLNSKSEIDEDNYVLIGRGYVDSYQKLEKPVQALLK